jgi:AcrR family transcriptional regulator
MLSKRQEEQRKLRKQSILEGALKVFKTHGIEKTTMDEIALESGFGKATLYYYFASKDEVFIAIMEDGWKKLWEGIESKIVEELGPRKKFMGIIKTMANIVRNNRILYGFLFTAPNHIQDESKQIWKTYQERLYAILKSIIEEGIKKKEFIDLNPGMLMKAIGGLFHGLLIENEDDLDEKEFELMLRNFLRPENARN